jgi:hypothetical protein
MSNARNLANLLGAGTTIAAASIADDALDDRLKLDGSSVATVTVNSAVSASTTIVVDGVSGTIAVGMVVNVSDTTVRSITDAASQSAISVDDTLTITAVASQTSFTVSEAVSIADNVVLILRADENSKMVLDASAASTDVGDEILFEDATNDGSIILDKYDSISQVKYVQTSALVTTTTQLPRDDTIPQKTEGAEFMTLSIIPTNSSNTLLIETELNLDTTTSNYMTVALFQDDTANAIAASFIHMSGVQHTKRIHLNQQHLK